jgi:type I restriction enzyme S subunit
MSAWPKVKLGDVLVANDRSEAVDASKEYRLLGVRLDGQGPFLRETVMGTQTAATRLFRVEAGDFIYSRLFACRGAFGVIEQELDGCYVSGEFPTFRPAPEKLDVRFLKYWFRLPSVIARVDEDCTGSTPLTRNRFKEQFFVALEIPLPPLAEQRRVVARIEELAAQIHEARTLRQQATEEAEALLAHSAQQMFPKSSTGVVGDWVSFQTGYAFKSEWFSESGVRLARNANVGHGVLDWSDTVRIPEAQRSEFSRFELAEADILIALDRPIISTGIKVARVRRDDLPCLLLQRVARAQFKDGTVFPNYFFRWLCSPRFVQAIDPGRSNGVPHISHKDIEKIPFAVPPLPDQRRIVAELDALQAEVDALKRHQDETAAELDALLPALLDRAFKGQL